MTANFHTFTAAERLGPSSTFSSLTPSRRQGSLRITLSNLLCFLPMVVPTGKSAMLKRRFASKGRGSFCCTNWAQSPAQKTHRVNSIDHTSAFCVLAAAMESMQTRLQDLTARCTRFEAKYGVRGSSADAGRVPDSISITLRCGFAVHARHTWSSPALHSAYQFWSASRSPVVGQCGTASPSSGLATCSCLEAACCSHVSQCNNMQLAGDTANKSAEGCSTSSTCHTGYTAAVDASCSQPAASAHCPQAAAHFISTHGCSHDSRFSKDEVPCSPASGRALKRMHGTECRAHTILGRTWESQSSSLGEQMGRTPAVVMLVPYHIARLM